MEQPVISLIQRVILYETKARYYVVGSNSTETKFRVLKIDRTEPRELTIHDDKMDYNKTQIRHLLTMIKSGNTNRESKKTDSSLIKSVSAFGMLGFVRFLEGYYMVMITKRRKVALIGPHVIYKIEETSMLYIPNDSVRYSHPEESRYVKMFQSVDLSSNFYFSYSYDLTHTLQYNMMPSVPPADNVSGTKEKEGQEDDQAFTYGVKNSPAEKYVWNTHLLKKCEHLIHRDWILHIIHGFVDQQNICVYGKPLYLTLVARRSNKFAGTRFLKRGSSCEGYVANEVETEQIVIDGSVTFLDRTRVTSFVQMRGSVPLYWSQDIAKMVPKPPITLDQKDPYAGAAGLHFNRLLKRYGSPIIILNLVKKREKRRHESILTGEFQETIAYLNQFLPSEHRIKYIGFDMAQVSKSKNKNVLMRLAEIANVCVKQTGLYVNMPKNIREDSWSADETCTAKHKSELSFGDDVCNEIRDKVCQLKSCSEHSQVDLLTSYLPADLTCGRGVSLVEDTEDRFEQSKAKQDDDLSDLPLSEDTFTDTDTTPVMSQGSSWSQSRKSQKDIFNDAMKMLSEGTYTPLRSQPSQSLDKLKYFTKTYYIRQAKSAIELICESIAPGQSHDLLQLVLKSYQNIGVIKTCVEEKLMDPLTLTVIEAYKKAEDYTTKTQILSLIVNKYSKSELCELIDGLTHYKIDKARKHASQYGPGHYVAPPKVIRIRLSKGKVQHFIEFISAPCFLQTVGFGSRMLKLSTGVEMKVPKVIRTMIATRLISAYNVYCQENDVVPPSRSTLFRIVKACAASQLTSLRGLDNHTSEGISGIDTLLKVVDKMADLGLEEGKCKELKTHLEKVKLHLKHGFSTHLQNKSSCVQHCIQYALGDSQCTDHEHSMNCTTCDSVYENRIQREFATLGVQDESQRMELEYDIETSCQKVLRWRDHCIRTVNQNACKANTLENLRDDEVLLISDWAMKYLPQTFREAQTEWFGKQGINWHITVALTRCTGLIEEDEHDKAPPYDIHSYIHLLDHGSQGWFAVAKILTHTMKVIKEKMPHLKSAYLRSDNAGCYHCGPLMAYLWANRQHLSLNVREYNFSEVQSGKDLCDARTGTCRLHILNHINEGHNVTNTSEMKEALESNGGIRNTYVTIISIDASQQPALSGPLKVPISMYNNYIFLEEGLQIFKAFGIGGEMISSTDLDRISRNMLQQCDVDIVESATEPRPKLSASRVHKQNKLKCSDPECVRSFFKESQLLSHLAVGKHLYDLEENDSTLDRTKRMWVDSCTMLRSNQPSFMGDTEMTDAHLSQFAENQGYALKKPRKNARFSSRVRNYLSKLFEEGETSGKKVSPYTVSKQMRNERDENGDKVFPPCEWLTHQQVRGFFASLSLKRQKALSQSSSKKRAKLEVEELQENDEELQNVINALVEAERMVEMAVIQNWRKIDITLRYKGMQGMKTPRGSYQTGVVRTNCVDCLDRTNTAQFAIGKCALGYQLYILGVVDSPHLAFDTDCLRMLEQLYEAQGDTIALQYGGSHLVHRIEGYRKRSPWKSHSKDIVHTLSRYYSNTFSDLEKQQATNIFLGLFVPVEGKLNIWELPTDYYLHNKDIIGILGYLCKSYSQWWDEPVYRSLPLPYDQVKKHKDCDILRTHAEDERVNNYEEYYKTTELTQLTDMFAMSVTHSVRDIKPKSAKTDSPFALRISTESKETGQERNPNISGKSSTSSTTSTGSEESSSESTDVEGDIDMSNSSHTSRQVSDIEEEEQPTGYISFPTPGSSYGTNLHKYVPKQHDLWTYERYVKIGEVCKPPEIEDDIVCRDVKKIKRVEIFPMSVFKLGSSYGVEPPPVNKQDQDVYQKYVMIGKHGPQEPSKKDLQLYTRYVNNKYM